MKSITTIFTAVSSLLLPSLAFASLLEVTPVAMDNPDHFLPNHLICLTREWEKVDADLHTKILSLKTFSPNAFNLNGTENPNLCYDPTKIEDQFKPDFDAVLRDMQRKTNSINLTNQPGPIILRNEDKTFLHKFLRGSAYVQGVQLTSIGVLLALPRSVSKWPEHPFADVGANLKRAYTTPPVWDKDDFLVNAGHPYAGAVYYNLVRSQGATMLQSFLFSTFQSVFWEYGTEAAAEQPSLTDLLTTSPIGSILGELAHRATLRMARNGFNSFGEKALVLILNPSYVLNNGFKVKHRVPVELP